jgi:hypothetical protein
MGLMSAGAAEKAMGLLAELSRRMRKKYFTTEGAEKE